MVKQTPEFRSPKSPRLREADRSWRVTAFWSVVGIVSVAALISVTVESSFRTTIAGASPASSMNLISAKPVTFIPLTGEPDFNDRFVDEKRNAVHAELPAQF